VIVRDDRILRAGDYDQEVYRCEYLVVGTGAGGSVAGKCLAEAGRNVLFLEEGPYTPTGKYTRSVSEMVSRLYRNEGASPFVGRPTIAFGEGRCVGGGTTINGGVIWRTPPHILEEWSRIHGLPGYGLEQLAPHFAQIERLLHVKTEELDDGNGDSVAMMEGARSLGWRTVMEPRAVIECKNTNLCPTGCPTGAKQGAMETYIPMGLEAGALLFSDCRALKIQHQGTRASSVLVEVQDDARLRFRIEFEHLVLAGGAVQTPHLLRRSGISKEAGRRLEFHMPLKVVALFDRDIDAARGTISTVQIQEFERDGLLMMTSNLSPHFLAIALSFQGDDAVNHVLDRMHRAGIYMALVRSRSVGRIFGCFLDQPMVRYRFLKEDLHSAKIALQRMSKVLFASGAVELYMPFKSRAVRSMSDAEQVIGSLKPEHLEILTVHAMSSCPMGISSASSVVDPSGSLWGFKNVLITDASVLPSNTGTSPQGTIMAFAHEIVSRHLNGFS